MALHSEGLGRAAQPVVGRLHLLVSAYAWRVLVQVVEPLYEPYRPLFVQGGLLREPLRLGERLLHVVLARGGPTDFSDFMLRTGVWLLALCNFGVENSALDLVLRGINSHFNPYSLARIILRGRRL